MSARDVIADSIAAGYTPTGEDDAASWEDDLESLATRVHHGLEAAGYAVVKLPEVDEIFDGETLFADGSFAGNVRVGKDGVIRHGGWEWTPDQAEAVGANWIAAARLTEAGGDRG